MASEILQFLAEIGITSGVVGLGFWLVENSIKKRDAKAEAERKKREAEQDAREATREKNEAFIIKGINESIELSTAVAKAVQRIPDAHCNGDMHEALEKAKKFKESYNEFVSDVVTKHIYE